MELINPISRYIITAIQGMQDGQPKTMYVVERGDEEGKPIGFFFDLSMAEAVLHMIDPPMNLKQLEYISYADGMLGQVMEDGQYQVDAFCGPVEEVDGGAWVPARVFISNECFTGPAVAHGG